MANINYHLENNTFLLIDGAMGTQLQAKGMPSNANPAEYAMENKHIIKQVHADYLQAGTNIILSCTFGGTHYKLPSSLDVFTFNKTMAEVAKEAVQEANATHPMFVAGDIGPTGQLLRPLGQAKPLELFEAYKAQVEGLVAGGVDLLFIETQFDIAETRIAVAAAKSVTELPIFVSMTFEGDTTLTGSSPKVFAATMENLGVSAIGINCGAGPEQMVEVVEELLAYSSLPIFAEPNAGLPELIGNETVFRLPPEPFANQTYALAKLGVQMLGGCCGTSPEHMSSLNKLIKNGISTEKFIQRKNEKELIITSRSEYLPIGPNRKIALIGERINPTGKKALSAEFQAGSINLAMQYAQEQIETGANLLDVNVGAAKVDEPTFLPLLVEELIAKYTSPLVLDSSNAKALINAIPTYPASCLINSISGEENRMETLAPHIKLWGTPTVLLPLKGGNLPATAKDRIEVIESLLIKAEEHKIPKHMLLVDVLALTAASDPLAPRVALETLEYCRKNGLATTIGLSNISFGLPAREIINASFLGLASAAGLNSCIGNPMNTRFKEELDAVNLLLGHDKEAEHFIENYSNYSPTATANKTEVKAKEELALTPANAVITGNKEKIIELLDVELQTKEAFNIINEQLIPALNVVGEKYEKKQYFLPQLLRSAETMQKAFKYLKPMLSQENSIQKGKIILATVEGDIHDIGKNIVGLVLENHGYQVIDLGKDVKASVILEEAKKHNVDAIGLSALMTTTMPRMEELIKLMKEDNSNFKVWIGGAVVTQDYADSIGANAYAEDAVSTVRILEKILKY